MAKPNRPRAVLSQNKPAPAPAPAPAAATAAPAPAPQPAPATVTQATSEPVLVLPVLTDLLSHVTEHKDSIDEAIRQIDTGSLRGYDDGLRASEVFGCSWEALAALRPKPFNETAISPSEAVFRDALDRADPTCSAVVTDEMAACIKQAVIAGSLETFKAARLQEKNLASRPKKTTDTESAASRTTLDNLVSKYEQSNNGVMRDFAKDCIDAIDDTKALVKLHKRLGSARTKGTNRRAILTMLDLVHETFEKHVPEDDRGGSYRELACKAKSLYEDYILDCTKNTKAITADGVKTAVLQAFSDHLAETYGEKMKDVEGKSPELTAQQKVDRLYDMINRMGKGKSPILAGETVSKLYEVLRAFGHKHSSTPRDEDLQTINEPVVPTAKRDKAPVEPTVAAPQPVTPPVKRDAPVGTAPGTIADAQAVLNA